MKITDDLEWNFEKCLNRFNSMGSLYKISNFVQAETFPLKLIPFWFASGCARTKRKRKQVNNFLVYVGDTLRNAWVSREW